MKPNILELVSVMGQEIYQMSHVSQASNKIHHDKRLYALFSQS